MPEFGWYILLCAGVAGRGDHLRAGTYAGTASVWRDGAVVAIVWPSSKLEEWMNNADLTNRIAAEAKVTKGTAKLVIESIFGEIAKAAARGEEVSIHGFGKFMVKDRAPRAGRNPRTGEAIQIAAAKGVSFVAAKALKARMND